MAQYVPHYENWQTIAKWRKAATVTFYFGFVLSVLTALKDYPVISQMLAEHPVQAHFLSLLLNSLTILTLFAYLFVDIVVEYYLSPAAEEKRKADFLDNAFGTTLLAKNSIDYYTNDDLSPGLYKAAVNLFENSFFTYRVTEAMTQKKGTSVGIVFVVVVLMALLGLSDQPLALPFLQLFFSSYIALDFVKFWQLRTKSKRIYDGWHDLFRTTSINQNPAEQTPEILRYWLMYETTLARLQVGLDSAVFDQLNDELSREWQLIKNKLHIKSNP